MGKKEFEGLSRSDEARIMLFAAHWCGYCSMFLKTASQLKAPDGVQLYLVDADDPDESLWDEYDIRLVPTIIVFRSGNKVLRKDGVPGVGLRSSDLEAALTFLSKMSKSG